MSETYSPRQHPLRMSLSLTLGLALHAIANAQQPIFISPPTFTICNYCIEAKRIGVPLNDGTFRDFSYSLFARKDSPSAAFALGAGAVDSGVYVERLYGVILESPMAGDTPVLVPQPNFKMYTFAVVGNGRMDVAQLKTRLGERFGSLIVHGSVCLGSQFKVPLHHFVALDDLPMAQVPFRATWPEAHVNASMARGMVYKPQSTYAMDLPPQGPTICEGVLYPAESIFKALADEQMGKALDDFAVRSNTSAINKIVDESTRRIITERFEELAAIVENAVKEGKAKQTVPPLRK